jgi:hypothetical protein
MDLRKARPAIAFAGAIALGGCVSYSPSNVGAMSTLEICELQTEQAPNLTPESRRLLESEVARRKESCSAYAPAIASRRAADIYRWTYGNQSP